MSEPIRDASRAAKWMLLISSVVTLVVLLATAIEENINAEWRKIQQEFQQELIAGAETDAQRDSADFFRVEIRQAVVPELEVVDRCQSCHVAADWPASPSPSEPLAAHPAQFLFLEPHPIDQNGCTTCHDGQGRAVSEADAHGRVAYWEQPMFKRQDVTASCLRCHADAETLRGAAPLAEGMQLVRRYGCYGCHVTPGFESLPPAGPPLGAVGEKVNYTWLVEWLKDPKSRSANARMPNFGFSDDDAHDVADYLFSLSATPRVDAPAPDVSDEAYDKGRGIYNTSRCSICHRTDDLGGAFAEAYAPELTTIGSKIRSTDWMVRWLGDPKDLYPGSKMPQFRLSPEERRDLASFLMAEYVDWDLEDTMLAASEPTREEAVLNGKRLVKELGCRGCHEIPGLEDDGELAPDLSSIGSRALAEINFDWMEGERTRAAWLQRKVKTPGMFPGEPKMPHFGFSDEEADRIATFLLGLDGREIPGEYRVEKAESSYEPVGPAAALFDDFKCLTCHSIQGRGGRFAPDLSFEGSAVKKEWMMSFLLATDLIRPLSKQMPYLRMSEEEAETLADYLTESLRDARIPPAPPEPSKETVEAGRRLYAESGCRACHQMDGNGGAVGPSLTTIGDRLTAGYLLERTRNPRRFTPDIVEPNYDFSEEQARALAAFLSNRTKLSQGK